MSAEDASSGHQVTAGSLDTMQGGPDDNSAQANHLVEMVGLEPRLAHSLCARTQKGGDPTTDTYLPVALNLRGRDGGAMPELADAASIRAASGGSSRSYVAANSVRRLTPTECERLQGFPDGWTIRPNQLEDYGPANLNPKPDSHRYRMMGNAVTVNVAEWLGKRIMEVGP